LIDDGWKLKDSVRLRKSNGHYTIDLFLEKSEPERKLYGKTIGMDCGYKKLLIDNENNTYDCGLEHVYTKISRKRQGSKAFKRALTERDNKINQSVNLIDFDGLKTVALEDLKNVKHKSNGKISKSFNSKLQRWSYSKTFRRIEDRCLEHGVNLVKVSPSYTSQQCSQCGISDKSNRKGETYCCNSCGMVIDSDLNAAINILHRGVYSLPGNENHNIFQC